MYRVSTRELFHYNRHLDLPDADITFIPEFISLHESMTLFASFQSKTPWQEREITVYGKVFMQPRLIAWYGDADKRYTYSGVLFEPLPWTPSLLRIKNEVEKVADEQFNSVLLNLYRDGRDGIAPHSDDEKEFGKNPTIASLSLGDTRKFVLRHKQTKETHALSLSSGDLLIMKETTQTYWKHGLPKTTRKSGPRINLTFRKIRE